MTQSSSFHAYNRALRGKLGETMREMREDRHLTFELMAAELRDKHRIPITSATANRWYQKHVAQDAVAS